MRNRRNVLDAKAVGAMRSISPSLALLAALCVFMHGNCFGADWRQYVVLTNRSVFGVAAKDGRLLWNYRPLGRMAPRSSIRQSFTGRSCTSPSDLSTAAN